jgi:hypothetical protein
VIWRSCGNTTRTRTCARSRQTPFRAWKSGKGTAMRGMVPHFGRELEIINRGIFSMPAHPMALTRNGLSVFR